jgi:hypothetical protein
VTMRETSGSTLAWSSPPGTARRSSRATSTAASTGASWLRGFPGLPCTAPARPVRRCWPLDVHPRVAMRILRHSKIAVTMEIYTGAPSDATRDALRKLSDWLT